MACRYSNDRITNELEELFNKNIPRFPQLPTPLLAFGAENRPGLNAKRITSDIISQFPKAGIDPGDNVWEKFTNLLVNTIVDAIVYDAKIQVGIKPNGIQMISQGANAGGPIIVVGQNITPVSANGVLN